MESIEPLVPWRFIGAVVAIKEPVMKLVEEITELDTTDPADFKLFKARMRCRRSDAVVE